VLCAKTTSAAQVAAQDMYKVDGGDGLTLLQSAMEESSRNGMPQEPPESFVDSSKAYKSLAESCKSTESMAPHVPATKTDCESSVDLAATERFSVGPSPTEKTSEDPPGAGTLKALLEFMIILLVFDGIRRWRLQKAEAAQQKKIDDARQDHQNLVDRAWEEMVKAAADGDVSNFKKALQHRPAMNREDLWGCSPLHFAAQGGSTEIATELLDIGADVNANDVSGDTPLHIAARVGHVNICEVLLSKGANINAMNEHGMTPLVVSGHANHEPVCRFLSDNGGSAGGMADEDLPPLVVNQVLRRILSSA